MNILFLSAGRRVELIQWFQNAKKELDIEGKVLAADISQLAPAIYYADDYEIVPRIGHVDFIDSIVEICNKHEIDLIIPTIDTELPVLAKNKEYIESRISGKALISSKETVDIGRNKFLTYEFFRKNGFDAPRVIDEEAIESKDYEFPLFIKPLDGSSSVNAFRINNERELDFFKDYVPNPIIQEFVEGDEYTIDVLCDFEGNPISIAPRKRVATRSGEVSKAAVTKDSNIIKEVKRMMEVLKPSGPITVQGIKGEDGMKFIEINPRFGGGAPISMKAGANSAKNIYKLLLGEMLDYTEEYEDGIIALRYDQAVYLDSNGERLK